MPFNTLFYPFKDNNAFDDSISRTQVMIYHLSTAGADITPDGKIINHGNKEYTLVRHEVTDFTTKALLSFGSTPVGGREILLLDPNKESIITDHYPKLAKIIKAKQQNPQCSTDDILQIVLDYIGKNLLDPTATPEEVENLFDLKNWKDRYVPPNEPSKDTAIVPLETYINEKKGVCRHHALLLSYYLNRLINDKLLPPGQIHHHRETLYDRGVVGHIWVAYLPDKTDYTNNKWTAYSLDSYWQRKYKLNINPDQPLDNQFREDYGTNPAARFYQRYAPLIKLESPQPPKILTIQAPPRPKLRTLIMPIDPVKPPEIIQSTYQSLKAIIENAKKEHLGHHKNLGFFMRGFTYLFSGYRKAQADADKLISDLNEINKSPKKDEEKLKDSIQIVKTYLDNVNSNLPKDKTKKLNELKDLNKLPNYILNEFQKRNCQFAPGLHFANIEDDHPSIFDKLHRNFGDLYNNIINTNDFNQHQFETALRNYSDDKIIYDNDLEYNRKIQAEYKLNYQSYEKQVVVNRQIQDKYEKDVQSYKNQLDAQQKIIKKLEQKEGVNKKNGLFSMKNKEESVKNFLQAIPQNDVKACENYRNVAKTYILRMPHLRETFQTYIFQAAGSNSMLAAQIFTKDPDLKNVLSSEQKAQIYFNHRYQDDFITAVTEPVDDTLIYAIAEKPQLLGGFSGIQLKKLLFIQLAAFAVHNYPVKNIYPDFNQFSDEQKKIVDNMQSLVDSIKSQAVDENGQASKNLYTIQKTNNKNELTQLLTPVNQCFDTWCKEQQAMAIPASRTK